MLVESVIFIQIKGFIKFYTGKILEILENIAKVILILLISFTQILLSRHLERNCRKYILKVIFTQDNIKPV